MLAEAADLKPSIGPTRRLIRNRQLVERVDVMKRPSCDPLSRDEWRGRDLGPGHEGLGASSAVVDGGKFVARKVRSEERRVGKEC